MVRLPDLRLSEKGLTQSEVSPFPNRDSQQYRLLDALLGGARVDPISAIRDLNVMIVSARVSELRRLGWPVRAKAVPHPNTEKFPAEKITVYWLDEHFRDWIGREGLGQHPSAYPFKDGRGKFAGWTADDYRKGQA